MTSAGIRCITLWWETKNRTLKKSSDLIRSLLTSISKKTWTSYSTVSLLWFVQVFWKQTICSSFVKFDFTYRYQRCRWVFKSGWASSNVMSHTTTEEKCGMDFSPSSGEATSGENKFSYESQVACHEWQIGKFTMPHFSSVGVCHNYAVSVNFALIKLNSNHLYCRCYFHNTYSWHLYCRYYFHNTYSWHISTVGVMS